MQHQQQIKTLFAEPYIGEFGWELFCYQGFLRKLAQHYSRTIVICRTSHDPIYNDFASDILYFDPEGEETDMWKNHSESGNIDFLKTFEFEKAFSSITLIRNYLYQSRWWTQEDWRKRQIFIEYNYSFLWNTGYDILLHIRNTQKCNSGFRNWPEEHAQKFVEQMTIRNYSIACVGKKEAALHIPGTEDLRDLPLSQLMGLMNHSGVIVGPQSGPTHLATLCRLPQMCWQTCHEHSDRVKYKWNPFNIDVETLPSSQYYWRKRQMWLPPVTKIIEKTEDVLNRKK